MKKLALIALLAPILILGCIEPTTECPVSQYLDQGVAVTYLLTDFEHIMSGNQLRLSFDMTNLGEATAEDITAEIIGPDNFYILDQKKQIPDKGTYHSYQSSTLYPPDPERCLEGNAITDEFILFSRSGKQTPEAGTPIRLRIHYKYTTKAWADLVVMSQNEWEKALQSGDRPRGNQWSSAAPVKVKVTVPDTPLVPESDSQSKPVKIRFEYALAGEVKAVADPTSTNRQICALLGWRGLGENIPNCVDEVRITLQEGLAFDTGHTKNFCGGVMGSHNCAFGPAEYVGGPVREAYLRPAKVSPDKQRAEDYVLWVTVTKDHEDIIQETLKIYVDATYQMETIYETGPVVIGHVG